MKDNKPCLTQADVSRVIEMAWEDRTPFEDIHRQFSLSEQDVIKLMRSALKTTAFRRWRARVSGRRTKHQRLRPEGVSRGYCPTQYKIQGNKKRR